MIQEIFAFLFTAEGGDKVASSLDDIDKKSKQVTAQNKELSNSFASLATSVISVTAAWKAYSEAMSITNQNDQLYLMQEMTGIGASTLAQLGLASEQFGGNVNTASHALMGLERNIMQLRKTGSGPIMQAAMWYGLGISSDPEKMLRNIAKRMESLPRRMKFDLGRMLGLDNSTIMLLGKGVQNLEKELKRAKEYTFVDEKKVEQSHELKKSISEMGYLIGGIGTDIMATISPHVQSIVEVVKNSITFLKEHKDFVKSIAIGVGLIWFFMGGWKTALGAISLTAKGLVFTAIVAAAEDIYKYFTGADSALGAFLEKNPELKEKVDALGQAVADVWDYLASGEAYRDLENWAQENPEFINGCKKLGKAIENIWEYIWSGDAKKDTEEVIKETVSAWENFKKWWTKTPPEEKVSDISSWFKSSWEWLTKEQGAWDSLCQSIIRTSVAFEHWRRTVAKPFITSIFQPIWDLTKTAGKLAWDAISGWGNDMLTSKNFQRAISLAIDAANDRLPAASDNYETQDVLWTDRELRQYVTDREGSIEHRLMTDNTQAMRDLTAKLQLMNRMDSRVGEGTLNTKNLLQGYKLSPLVQAQNANPTTNNVTIQIYGDILSEEQAFEYSEKAADGFLNAVGNYSRGVR